MWPAFACAFWLAASNSLVASALSFCALFFASSMTE
jgi:hypothetical protein